MTSFTKNQTQLLDEQVMGSFSSYDEQHDHLKSSQRK